jgi:hypothetical protein
MNAMLFGCNAAKVLSAANFMGGTNEKAYISNICWGLVSNDLDDFLPTNAGNKKFL